MYISVFNTITLHYIIKMLYILLILVNISSPRMSSKIMLKVQWCIEFELRFLIYHLFSVGLPRDLGVVWGKWSRRRRLTARVGVMVESEQWHNTADLEPMTQTEVRDLFLPNPFLKPVASGPTFFMLVSTAPPLRRSRTTEYFKKIAATIFWQKTNKPITLCS